MDSEAAGSPMYSGEEYLYVLITTYEILHEECHEIMKHDVAIVKVRMESGKYIRTIMDKRMTFADKLAAFGIIS